MKILTEGTPEYNQVFKALHLYLSAGSKEQRQQASVEAKKAYKIMTGEDHVNENETRTDFKKPLK